MCMPPDWQAHVIHTYCPRGNVRDVNKYVAGTIGGVRRLIFSGMSTEERLRLQSIAMSGERIAYMPCDQYGSTGRCRYGDNCTHPHIPRA